MNYDEEEIETIINNEYDYSTTIITAEYIGYIIQYCEKVYNHLNNLIEEDKARNEKIKYEFQTYNYHTFYGTNFLITIRDEHFKSVSCKSYDSYIEAVNSDKIKNIGSLEIDLDLDYKRGAITQLKEHENAFKMILKPYNIKFIRKSNHNEFMMNQVENSINEILNKFPTVNTIFCSK